MVGLRFNSIGVSDGISNGTDGMERLVESRALVAPQRTALASWDWLSLILAVVQL